MGATAARLAELCLCRVRRSIAPREELLRAGWRRVTKSALASTSNVQECFCTVFWGLHVTILGGKRHGSLFPARVLRGFVQGQTSCKGTLAGRLGQHEPAQELERGQAGGQGISRRRAGGAHGPRSGRGAGQGHPNSTAKDDSIREFVCGATALSARVYRCAVWDGLKQALPRRLMGKSKGRICKSLVIL